MAAEAVAEASSDAIRLRHALDTLPQAVIVSDEHGEVVFRNSRAIALMGNRHGDALAAQAVNELLENAGRSTRRSGRSSCTVRRGARSSCAPRHRQRAAALGMIAVIEDVSERRRLEEVRRDFVANVSHELKTPMGALGLLAETLLDETDPAVSRRLAERIHTEAFRISRIIDDLLDLVGSRARRPAPRAGPVNLVMAEAAERVRAAAEQRGSIELEEPSPPVPCSAIAASSPRPSTTCSRTP